MPSHLINPCEPIVQHEKLLRRRIELQNQDERGPPAWLPLRLTNSQGPVPPQVRVKTLQELGMEPGKNRFHDPRIVQVEAFLYLQKARRQLLRDLPQVVRVLLGAALQFLLGGEGDPVILGAETLQQVRREELHGFFLALRLSVS